MTTYAETTDVEAVFRPLTAAETTKATFLLTVASAILRTEIPSIDTRLEEDLVEEVLVRATVAQMVVRVLQNPEGYKSEVDGDYSYSLDASRAAGELQLTAGERQLLAPAPTSTAGSIRLAVPRSCW